MNLPPRAPLALARVAVAVALASPVLAQAPPAYRDLPPRDSLAAQPAPPAAAARGGLGDYEAHYYHLAEVNAGLPAPPDTFYLLSPQETMESFVRACRAGRFATAAHALNLNLVPRDRQAARGATLAQQLFYVLDQRIGIDWGALPDRPDGAATTNAPGASAIGAPRRSVPVGDLTSEGREVALRLQRVRVGEAPPRWLWAMTTVEEVPGLYANYGPGWLERRVPYWTRARVLGVQAWVLAGMLLGVALCWGLGWLVYRGLRWLCRVAPARWLNVLGEQLAQPVGAAVGILGYYYLLREALALSGPVARGFYTLLLIVVVGTVVWVASRAVDYAIGFFLERNLADVSDEANDAARRRMTMLSVARRLLVFVLLVVGTAVIISRIDGLERVGYALLGSAGFAAVVLGIAAQSTLGNLVAGIQVAVTQPVRIGDAVLYEGNWGNVEDVRFTYLVIRTWDLRRVVVPLKYFIDHPFENWSMTDSKLLKPFYVYADYRVDVDRVRAKFDELVRGHERYNGHEDPDFIVYAAEDDCIRMRGTVSAEDSSKAWTLHYDVREALVAYVAKLEGALPRERVASVGTEGGTAAATANEVAVGT